jgi:hypothetical protein
MFLKGRNLAFHGPDVPQTQDSDALCAAGPSLLPPGEVLSIQRAEPSRDHGQVVLKANCVSIERLQLGTRSGRQCGGCDEKMPEADGRCCQVAEMGRLWQTLPMRRPQNPYRGFRFPPEIIAHAVWL